MSLSPLQKSLLTSASIGSVLFGILTIPLAAYRSLPVEVNIRNQPVFENELNALAGPYLGVAGTVSVALGIGILGISGWQAAGTQSEVEKAKRSELERNLIACKAELERIKFSDARLQNEKLGDFLQPEHPPVTQQHQASTPQPVYHEMPAQACAVVQGQQYLEHYRPTASNHRPAPTQTVPSSAVSYSLPGEAPTAQPSSSSSRAHLHTTNAQVAANLATAPISYEPTASENFPADNHVEANSEQNLQVMLTQLHELMARVESLQTEKTNPMAA